MRSPRRSPIAPRTGTTLALAVTLALLAGAPLVAIGTVAAIGAASALATLAYVRLTGGSGERSR